MDKPAIGLDFDDVLFDFLRIFTLFHNKRFGTNLTYEDNIDYDNFHVTFGCSAEEMAERVLLFNQLDDHYLVSPIEGAVEVVERLTERFAPQVVTARQQEHARGQLISYTQRHFRTGTFAGFNFANSYITNKEWVGEIRTKAEICQSIGATCMIEDSPKHARIVAEAGIPVLLMDRPWNRELSHPLVTRITSWNEVEALL